jgi:hypothetical protein
MLLHSIQVNFIIDKHNLCNFNIYIFFNDTIFLKKKLLVSLWIKILKNNDHRQLITKKKKIKKIEVIDQQNSNKPDGMTTIADFLIDDLFTKVVDGSFKWSLGISNIQEYQEKYFILVAVSRINVDEEMTSHKSKNNKNNKKRDYQRGLLKEFEVCLSSRNNAINVPVVPKGGTAIYRLKLKNELVETTIIQYEREASSYYILDVTCFYSDKISGICKFVEVFDKESEIVCLKRFIILNFHEMYNFKFKGDFKSFKLNEKFEYPKSFRSELNNETLMDCTDKLLTCLYDQYFLIERYKNNVQVLEGN